MSELSVIYSELSAVELGPVDIDLYIDELQSEIEKTAMRFNFNGYQNALSELRAIGEKPCIILDMPETGIELPRAADLIDDSDDEETDEEETETEEEEEAEEKELSFAERMAIAKAAKKAMANN